MPQRRRHVLGSLQCGPSPYDTPLSAPRPWRGVQRKRAAPAPPASPRVIPAAAILDPTPAEVAPGPRPPPRRRFRARPQCAPPAPPAAVLLHDGTEWRWRPPQSRPLHRSPERMTPSPTPRLQNIETLRASRLPASVIAPQVQTAELLQLLPGSPGSPSHDRFTANGVSTPRHRQQRSPRGRAPPTVLSPQPPSPTAGYRPELMEKLIRALALQRAVDGADDPDVPAEWDQVRPPVRAPPLPPSPPRQRQPASPAASSPWRREQATAALVAPRRRHPTLGSLLAAAPAAAPDTQLDERAAERALVECGVRKAGKEAARISSVARTLTDALQSPIPGAAGDECTAVAAMILNTDDWRAVQAAFRALNGNAHELGRSLTVALRRCLPSEELSRVQETLRLNGVAWSARPGPPTPQQQLQEEMDRELRSLLASAGRRLKPPQRVFRPARRVGGHVLDVFGSDGDCWLSGRGAGPKGVSPRAIESLVHRLTGAAAPYADPVASTPNAVRPRIATHHEKVSSAPPKAARDRARVLEAGLGLV